MSDQQLDDEPLAVAHIITSTQNTQSKVLCPVTIFQVLQAGFLDNPGALQGKSLYVGLVAHVSRVEINAAKLSYILEDGTGRIYASKPFTSSIHHVGSSSIEAEEEITQCLAFEHTYVEVVGLLENHSKSKPMISIESIHPVNGYHQVMFHILNVIHINILSQQCIQPFDSDQDLGSTEDMENMLVDDVQRDTSIQPHIDHDILVSHPVLPSMFSPQKHHPYATLKPLERAIMKYMHHHRNHHVLIPDLAQAVYQSSGCTEFQFNLAVQTLLAEAYITSPLDDGYVVITPRH